MTANGRDKLTADLSAYLDGELPPERTRQIEQHLAESEDARQTLEQLRRVSDQLAHLPRARAPDELTAAMRRHAERSELLDQPRPTSRARILPLFVRLSAAAAVLIGCVLVGRQMLTRDQAPPKSGTTLTNAQPRAADEGQRFATAKKLREQEIDLPQIREAPAAVALAPADTLALDTDGTPTVSAAVGIVAGEPVDTDTSATVAGPERVSSPDYSAVARVESTTEALDAEDMYYGLDSNGDKSAAIHSPEPSVEVLITPQNSEQYAAAYLALTEWSADQPGVELAVAADLGRQARLRVEPELRFSDRAGDGLPPSGARATGQISAANVTTFIEHLERQAPQQVHFQLRSSRVDLLRKLGQPAEERFVAAPTPEKSEAETIARGAVVGRQPTGGAKQPPQEGVHARRAGTAERRAAEGPAKAGRGGGHRGTRARDDEADRKPRASRPEPARPDSKGAARGRMHPQTITPPAEPVSPSIAIEESAESPPPQEPKQPAAEAATQPSQPSTTSTEAARRLLGRYILGGLFGALNGSDREEPHPIADAVAFRVTLLPPPAAASQPNVHAGRGPATAPTSQPAPQP